MQKKLTKIALKNEKLNMYLANFDDKYCQTEVFSDNFAHNNFYFLSKQPNFHLQALIHSVPSFVCFLVSLKRCQNTPFAYLPGRIINLLFVRIQQRLKSPELLEHGKICQVERECLTFN